MEPLSPSRRNFTAADLVPGRAYRVIRAFEDYDGEQHPVGERWRFVKKDFLPYEDGLTLHGELNGQALRIRLQWREEAQGHIIDRFSNFSKSQMLKVTRNQGCGPFGARTPDFGLLLSIS